MNEKADCLIRQLSPEIDRKCEALRESRRERRQSRLFLLVCALAVVLPAALVLAGISMLVLLVPVAFMSLSILSLLPVLSSNSVNGKEENAYEQA